MKLKWGTCSKCKAKDHVAKVEGVQLCYACLKAARIALTRTFVQGQLERMLVRAAETESTK